MVRTTVITAGEMKRLMWIAESNYGVTPTGALGLAAEYYSIKDDSDFAVVPHWLGSNRSYTSTTRGPIKAGFTVKAVARANSVSPAYNWVNFFALNAFGATTGLTEHLPSFSSVVDIQEVTGGTVHDYFLFNGCKINKLVIGATDPGKIVTFDATVLARLPTWSASKTFAGLQAVTVGADPSAVTTDPITWSGILQYNLGGAGLANWAPRKWSLTVDNKLVVEPANLLGADSANYSVANTLEEGQRDIILDVTLPARDQGLQTAKRLGTAMTAVTIPIGDKVITLTGGTFQANDYPEYKQDVNEESAKIIFQNLTIA